MNVVDVIQFEGNPRVLVWKSPIEDFNAATQLIVDETHEAIVMIEGRTEVLGPGRHTLETQNYFGLNAIQRMATGGQTAFPCKVFFVNKVHAMDMLWGTKSTLPVMDPDLGIMLHLQLRGNLSFVVENSKKFVEKFVGFVNVFNDEQVVDQFRGIIATEVTDKIAKMVLNDKVGLFTINAHLREISDKLMVPLQALFDEYGAKLVKFNVETINSDNEDTAEFQAAKSAAAARVIQADSEAKARRLQGYSWSDEQQASILKELAGNDGAAGSFIGGMLGIGTAGAMAAPVNGMINGFFGGGGTAGTATAAGAVPQQTAQSAPQAPASAPGMPPIPMPGGVSSAAPTPTPTPAPQAASSTPNAAGTGCPQCHQPVQPGWVACPFCGASLGKPKCPNCAQELQPGWKACPFCGTKL
ncbi:SPFH domain-containing protein [Bifidobacterium sp. LC6]|uniref:SPFH domain-containing protein n=1 Tax=Bifidobacterium colobi TaxID=2809026 RepID=A0ABS5UTE6_9BIFI|nr:SPFH domain-containing protein [Bifidobacterium colobi]MBT1174061.1 SPFH domain-containing protein [Bifidobacterium colobi]